MHGVDSSSLRNLNEVSIVAIAVAIACIGASMIMMSSTTRNMAPSYGSDGGAGNHRDFYDGMAAHYDKVDGASEFRDWMLEELSKKEDWIGVNWNKDQLRILDYAAGTGVVSHALVSLTSSDSSIVAIDTSESMVREYNRKTSTAGLNGEKMRAIAGDLISDGAGNDSILHDKDEHPEFWEFDLVVVSLGFHHFPDHAQAMAQLRSRLRAGGVLLVIDYGKYEMIRPKNKAGASNGLMGHSHGQHGHHNHHHHHHHASPSTVPNGGSLGESTTTTGGFDEAEVIALMKIAGFKDVKYDEGVKGFTWGPPPGMEKMAQEMGMPKIVRDIFLVRGEKN